MGLDWRLQETPQVILLQHKHEKSSRIQRVESPQANITGRRITAYKRSIVRGQMAGDPARLQLSWLDSIT